MPGGFAAAFPLVDDGRNVALGDRLETVPLAGFGLGEGLGGGFRRLGLRQLFGFGLGASLRDRIAASVYRA
jgi:hypothetical protein